MYKGSFEHFVFPQDAEIDIEINDFHKSGRWLFLKPNYQLNFISSVKGTKVYTTSFLLLLFFSLNITMNILGIFDFGCSGKL